jgi:protein subunit release factor B
MCTGVELALAASAIAGTAAGVKAQRDAKKEAIKTRDVMVNAEAERKAAEDKAAQDAQQAIAARRRRLRSQSLLTSGASGQVAGGGSALAMGKPTLGA